MTARYNPNGALVVDEERLMEERLIKIEQQSTKVHLECKHGASCIAAEAAKYAARCSEISSACDALATSASGCSVAPGEESLPGGSGGGGTSGMLVYRESSNHIEHMHKLALEMIELGTEMAAASLVHKDKFVSNYLEYVKVRDEWLAVMGSLHTVSDRADEFYVKGPISRLEERIRRNAEKNKE